MMSIVGAAILVLVGVALTLAAQELMSGPAIADHPDDSGAIVRISAMKSDNGAVRVALQQQESGGDWGKRQHPQLNTIGPDARTGIWLNSSPIETAAQVAAIADEPGKLYCVVAHGSPGDYFWRLLRGYVALAESHLNADVRFFTSLDGAEQAQAIEQCAADGAAAIASTLADPEAVTPALLAAKASGSRIVTFNSGAEYAKAAGAELHIALDDTRAGRLAGTTFNERGVSGDIACVIHEAENIGLEERCNGLEETYAGGNVLRLRLTETTEPGARGTQIAERLTDPNQPAIYGMLVLNLDTLLEAFDAVLATADQLTGRDVKLGGIGGSPSLVRYSVEQRNRHLAFTISNLVEPQGYLITAALRMVDSFHLPSKFILTPNVLTATPFVYDNVGFRVEPEEGAEIRRRLAELFAASEQH